MRLPVVGRSIHANSSRRERSPYDVRSTRILRSPCGMKMPRYDAPGRARSRGRPRSRRCSTRPPAGEGRVACDRGPGRDRQDAAAGRGAPRAAERRRRGARRPRGRARARVPVRRRAPAVRGAAGRPERREPRCRAGAARGVFAAAAVSDGGGRRRRVVRRAARPVLADAQPRRRAAAAARGRRPALVRPRRRCASSPTWRGGSRACRCSSPPRVRTGEPGDRRRAARPRSPTTRRPSRVRPGPLSADAVARARRATGSAPSPTRRSAPPATRRPAATRCSCASC